MSFSAQADELECYGRFTTLVFKDEATIGKENHVLVEVQSRKNLDLVDSELFSSALSRKVPTLKRLLSLPAFTVRGDNSQLIIDWRNSTLRLIVGEKVILDSFICGELLQQSPDDFSFGI